MLLCFELRRSVLLLSSERWILQDKVLGSRLLILGIILWRNYSLFDQSSCCGFAWHSFPIFLPSNFHTNSWERLVVPAWIPKRVSDSLCMDLCGPILECSTSVTGLYHTRNCYDSVNILVEKVDSEYGSSSYTALFIMIWHFVECYQRCNHFLWSFIICTGRVA
jgi:hypothetical protein